MDDRPIRNVMVTGATGFVGREVVRELLRRGLTPVCVARSPRKVFAQHPDVSPDRLSTVTGSLADLNTLSQAAEVCQACIHLVGIIIERRLQGQTFKKVNVEGTRNVVHALRRAGVSRLAHMSALGSRSDSPATYHRTKWAAEEYVRQSGLDWTIFRPSLIHGPQGEFMRLMKQFMCGWIPPAILYFGSGKAKLQPVSVKDVAYCLVESLERPETVGQAYDLGGPKAYSWVEFYNACRAMLPGSKRWKPMISQSVKIAKLMAAVSAPPMAVAELVIPSLGLFRFDAGQVMMSQEENTCDQTVAEKAFGLTMRPFEEDLANYAEQIG